MDVGCYWSLQVLGRSRGKRGVESCLQNGFNRVLRYSLKSSWQRTPQFNVHMHDQLVDKFFPPSLPVPPPPFLSTLI